MTSLKLTQQTQVKNVDIVTPNIVKSCESSANFMKELTVVAISTLTIMKNTFPKDNNFIEQNFGGKHVWVLKEKCEDQIAQFVSDSVRSSFDAIDKKYLHQLALCFYKEGGTSLENLLEYYIFEFDYKMKKVSMSGNYKDMDSSHADISFEDIQKAAVALIQSCNILACGFPSLPAGYDVIIRLYYNNDAPKGYQPPGFKAGDKRDDNLLSVLDNHWDSIMTVGPVTTPFHQLSVYSYSRDQEELSSCAVNPSADLPWIESADFISQPAPVDDNTKIVTCPCNDFKDIAKTYVKNKPQLLVKCIYCHGYQHAICFGVLAEDKRRRDLHCCNICYEENRTRTPTDSMIAKNNSGKEATLGLYLYRHALYLCTRVNTIDVKQLMNNFGITEKHARQLLKTFANFNIIKDNINIGLTTPNKILNEGLKNVMEKYFYLNHDDLAEQILMEVTPNDNDSLGDILTPLQSISLNNTEVFKLVEQASNKPETDETMEQFRKVIMKDDEPFSDELPLSGTHNPVNLKEQTSFKRKLPTDNSEVKTKKGKTVRFKLN